ncbi:MAG: hypothetical protein ABI905_01900 [Betaproteobacteria bacterium]
MERDEDTKWKIEIFRDKLRHSLSARFLLRFHVGLILIFTILNGWLVDVSLLKLGVSRMATRYFVSILVAYGAFYLGVYLWIEYSGIKEYIKIRKAHMLVGDEVPRMPPENMETWEWHPAYDALGCLGGIEGCLVVIAFVGALMAAFYFLGGYVAANALAFFSDIVLELLLAAGLLRGLNRYEASGWMISVWRSTRWSLAFALFVALVCGGLAQSSYPTAKTVPDVIKQWRR